MANGSQLKRLENALRLADEQGNERDAQIIANEIRRIRQEGQPQELTPSSGIRAAGETALAFGSGTIAQPIAGLAGIGSGIYDVIRGKDDALGSAVETIRDVQNTLTVQPKSQLGQQATGTVAAPFEALSEAARTAGGKTQEATQPFLGQTGSALAGTAVGTGIEFVPGLFGVRTRSPGFRQRAADVGRIEQEASEIGVNLSSGIENQRQRIQEAASEEISETPFAQSTPQIKEAVIEARNTAKRKENQLYSIARQEDQAAIPVEDVKIFRDTVAESLDSFDVDDMPVVRKRLERLNKIDQMDSNASVKLNEIEKWRQSINRNMPSDKESPESAALTIMRGQLDNFLEDKFNADMIRGNQAAIEKWRNARQATKHLKETFDENDVLVKMRRHDASPEEMRRWIFGANKVGFNTKAADTVKALKRAVGEESPQFAALRQDALYNLYEPLLREEPNYSLFIKNYENTLGGKKPSNPTLNKELFGDAETNLRKVYQFAKALEGKDGGSSPMTLRLDRALSVGLFGHELAKKALLVRVGSQAANALGRSALGAMRLASGRTRKKEIMGEILGYNPSAPLIPKQPAIVPSTVEAGQQLGGAQPEQPQEDVPTIGPEDVPDQPTFFR